MAVGVIFSQKEIGKPSHLEKIARHKQLNKEGETLISNKNTLDVSWQC